MKKLLSLILSTLIIFTGLVGCTSNDNGGELGSFRNRPKEVVVYYVSNAYGSHWITEIAKSYMTNHNTDTYINLKKTATQTSDLSKIESGVGVGDLYILGCHMEDRIAFYEDLSDVLNSYPIGEEGKTKIGDKLEEAYINYYNNSGATNFIIPHASISGGYNFAYNKSVLDRLFPDGYTLPRTTNEFIELGNQLKSKDSALLTCSFGDNSDYGALMFKAWFAQLIGFEAYEQFLDGKYYDETQGKYVFDENKPTTYSKYQESIMDYFNILKTLYSKENAYIHENSGGLTAMKAEAVLADINEKSSPFMIQGGYVEQEMNVLLEGQKSKGKPQEIRMMQMPVASEIIKRTPSIKAKGDAGLREVIDYVDKIFAGETPEKPAGVTDADIEIIKEARSICGSYLAGGMVVPKAAKNKDGAKDFLKYFASDEAAIIAARNANGLNLLPFSKDVSEEELGFKRTAFMNDCMRISNAITKVCSSDSQEHKFAYVTSFAPSAISVKTYVSRFFNGQNTQSIMDIYNDNYAEFANDWKNNIIEFKAQGGSTEN